MATPIVEDWAEVVARKSSRGSTVSRLSSVTIPFGGDGLVLLTTDFLTGKADANTQAISDTRADLRSVNEQVTTVATAMPAPQNAGPTGLTGLTGATGLTGPQGERGQRGATGESVQDSHD